MAMRLAKLLMLTLIQGEFFATFAIPNNKDKNTAVIYSANDIDEESSNIINPFKGYLPSQVDDLVNVKNRRSIQKRTTGRSVNIPYDVVEKMMNTPFSDLSTDLPDVQNMILDNHNKYRREASPCAKNMLKMLWSPAAAKTANTYAQKCIEGHSPPEQRVIPNFKCGENIFYSNQKVTWDIVGDSWHSECADFKFGYGTTTGQEIGHYTQMMWATTYLMGCAVAECSSGNYKYVYVCHCCPAGNKGSRLFPWKEGTSCGDCPNSCENNLCTNPCGYQDFYKNCPNLNGQCTSTVSMKSDCPATCECTKGEIK